MKDTKEALVAKIKQLESMKERLALEMLNYGKSESLPDTEKKVLMERAVRGMDEMDKELGELNAELLAMNAETADSGSNTAVMTEASAETHADAKEDDSDIKAFEADGARVYEEHGITWFDYTNAEEDSGTPENPAEQKPPDTRGPSKRANANMALTTVSCLILVVATCITLMMFRKPWTVTLLGLEIMMVICLWRTVQSLYKVELNKIMVTLFTGW